MKKFVIIVTTLLVVVGMVSCGKPKANNTQSIPKSGRILSIPKPFGNDYFEDESGDLMYKQRLYSLNPDQILDSEEEAVVELNRTKNTERFLTKYTDYRGEYKINVNAAYYVLGLSPSKKYAAVSAISNLVYEDEYRDKINNRKIRQTYIYDFQIINLETHEIKSLGIRKYIYYDQYELRESGPLYFILKWDRDDELYLLEQTKDEEFVINGSQEKFYPGMDSFVPQVPKASAKIVKLSLKDFSLTEVDGFNKPPRAWMCYSDHTTGVTGYIGMHDGPIISKTNTNLNPFPSIISNLDCTKMWNMEDLEFEDIGIELLSKRIVGSGYVNEKLYAFIDASYKISEGFRPDEITEENPIIPEVIKSVLYALDIESGELRKVLDVDENLVIAGTYIASDLGREDVTFISRNDISKTYHTIKIEDDFEIKKLDQCNFDDYPLPLSYPEVTYKERFVAR